MGGFQNDLLAEGGFYDKNLVAICHPSRPIFKRRLAAEKA
jgi:hypothetical protein